MLDDKKLVEKIKNDLNSYKIRTNSQDILHSFYNQEEKEEKSKFDFKKLIPFTSIIVLTLAIIISINPFDGFVTSEETSSNNLSDETTSLIIENESPKEQTAFSIFSAVTFIDRFNTSSILSRNKIDLDTFSEIVSIFDPTYEIVHSLFDDKETYNTCVHELSSPYEGKYGEYKYAMNVKFNDSNHFFFTDMSLDNNNNQNIEQEFVGELFTSKTNSYKTEIKIDDSHFDGQEIEMEIEINNQKTLIIEQETSRDNKKYSYTIKNENETIYKEELMFKRGKRKKDGCKLDITSNNKIYSFNDIRPEKDGLASQYRYEMYEGQFRLKVENDSHIYSDFFDSSITKTI